MDGHRTQSTVHHTFAKPAVVLFLFPSTGMGTLDTLQQTGKNHTPRHPIPAAAFPLSVKNLLSEAVPKPIDCALTRTVLGQALAVFQVFILAKLRSLKLLSQNFSFGKASSVIFFPVH
jgi:hypothetical protein